MRAATLTWQDQKGEQNIGCRCRFSGNLHTCDPQSTTVSQQHESFVTVEKSVTPGSSPLPSHIESNRVMVNQSFGAVVIDSKWRLLRKKNSAFKCSQNWEVGYFDKTYMPIIYHYPLPRSRPHYLQKSSYYKLWSIALVASCITEEPTFHLNPPSRHLG